MARIRRTLSAPLLGSRSFADLPLAGAIAGPDEYMGFRREFVRQQRARERQEKAVAAAAEQKAKQRRAERAEVQRKQRHIEFTERAARRARVQANEQAEALQRRMAGKIAGGRGDGRGGEARRGSASVPPA